MKYSNFYDELKTRNEKKQEWMFCLATAAIFTALAVAIVLIGHVGTN